MHMHIAVKRLRTSKLYFPAARHSHRLGLLNGEWTWVHQYLTHARMVRVICAGKNINLCNFIDQKVGMYIKYL